MKLIKLALVFIAITISTSAMKRAEIIAQVGDDIITNVHLDKRVSLMISSAGLDDTNKMRAKIANKAVQQLIKEAIHRAYGAKMGLGVTTAEINEAFSRIAKSNNMEPEQFARHLVSNNISIDATLENLKAQVLWQKIMVLRIRPSIGVTDEEVEERFRQISSQLQGKEVLVNEILITVADSKAETKQLVDELYNKARSGADFAAMARQFSESPSAKDGGRIDWMNISQLGNKIAKKLDDSGASRLTLEPKYDGTYEFFRIIHISDVRKTDRKVTRDEVKKYLLSGRLERASEQFMNKLYNETYIEMKR